MKSIKTFISHLFMLIAMAFSDVKNFIHDHATQAVNLLEAVKAVVDSKAVDFITALTPFGWDDLLKEKLSLWLAEAINELQVIEFKEDHSADDKINAFIEHAKTLPAPMQHAIYMKLASLVAGKSSETEMSECEVDSLVQMAYAHLQEKKTAVVNHS